VTVCVAAIAERYRLIGVSDRMLTAGDVEFEPEQSKLWMFSNSMAALIAGDMSIQTQIFRELDIEVKRRILATPNDWVSVRWPNCTARNIENLEECGPRKPFFIR
jgi:hypothetical protein